MERLAKNELNLINIHNLQGVMDVSLWVLEYLSSDSEKQFGASEVANHIIERLGISTSRQAVHLALTSAVKKKFCHKTKTGFSIMKLGQDRLLQYLNQEKVILIEPGKPFTAGIKLETIFSSVDGVLKISDPYIDIKTLNVLHDCIDPKISIRLLTVQIKDSPKFKGRVLALQQEGYNLEVRVISAGVLHDRYFIDNKHFWLSGNSLNNIGKKESFIVALDGDIKESMRRTFDSRWQSAISI